MEPRDGCRVGRLAVHLVIADPLPNGAGSMLGELHHKGINRILLATGDRVEVAERVTEGLGLDGLRAELSPEQKVPLIMTE
nr:HAD family hydrolase [Rhizobium leucaenae]